MADEVTSEEIATAALEPQSMSGEQGSVSQRSIDELLKARNAAAGANAASKVGFGIRVQKIRPEYQ